MVIIWLADRDIWLALLLILPPSYLHFSSSQVNGPWWCLSLFRMATKNQSNHQVTHQHDFTYFMHWFCVVIDPIGVPVGVCGDYIYFYCWWVLQPTPPLLLLNVAWAIIPDTNTYSYPFIYYTHQAIKSPIILRLTITIIPDTNPCSYPFSYHHQHYHRLSSFLCDSYHSSSYYGNVWTRGTFQSGEIFTSHAFYFRCLFGGDRYLSTITSLP